MRRAALALLLCLSAASLRSDDGYRLWLRYERMADAAARSALAPADGIALETAGGGDGRVMGAAARELDAGYRGLGGIAPRVTVERRASPDPSIGPDGFWISHRPGEPFRIRANQDVGILYGAFALLRQLQAAPAGDVLDLRSAPRIQRRILDHWDNLNGFVERGYAGASLWDWFQLPAVLDPRYTDYARACASVGINGVALNNVNADPLALTGPYLEKAAALAGVFRPYGLRVYLAVRFSSPIEIGGLPTADPLDPAVTGWWRAKADEIYRLIPDFGGFLVKANSEGQPGPQDYGRTHADGANLLARAVGPHGGIVMWRAFVYSQHDANDRTKQAFNEFHPLDGKFRDNVLLQIKNGPLDFQPREPFHPLFGAMPHTPLALEVQLTQEYLGASVYLAYLAPLYKECLDSDTFRPAAGATVARVVDGSLDHHALSAIAGVANIGSDRNWTGHPLSAANWYAFGRLAWDPALGAEAIAAEWARQSLTENPAAVATVVALLMASRAAIVDGNMPLGLHHIMARDHHYGPGPWTEGGRPDWTAPYYHRADAVGLGFERTAAGSDSLAQYAPELARKWGDLATCPEDLLLWFHHVPWDYRMRSGRTMWDELCLRYQRGVDEVRAMQREWDGLGGAVDAERFHRVHDLLALEEAENRAWRDACIPYFRQFSRRPVPAGVEAPAHPLAYYEAVQLHYVPGTPGGK